MRKRNDEGRGMREILFRGKDIDNGIFVTGYLIGNETCKKYITLVGSYCKEVIPKTVGQYTGLTDKNGKKIFEGDIIKNQYEKNKYQYFKISYCNRTYCWLVVNKYGMLGNLYNVIGDIEVIGNIYDNPELLKGE